MKSTNQLDSERQKNTGKINELDALDGKKNDGQQKSKKKKD